MNTDRFKFRAWDKAWKQMVYPDIIYHNINLGCSIHRAFKPSDGDMYFPLQENLILMQCIGLKDIEGKLIYEGDIVEHTISEVLLAVQIKGAPAKIKYTVEIGNGAFGDIVNGFKLRSHEPYPFNSPLWIHNIQETKIIGNIYELQT